TIPSEVFTACPTRRPSDLVPCKPLLGFGVGGSSGGLIPPRPKELGCFNIDELTIDTRCHNILLQFGSEQGIEVCSLLGQAIQPFNELVELTHVVQNSTVFALGPVHQPVAFLQEDL